MTSSDCRTTDSLLGREPCHLSEAERLRLEHHLEQCAACRQNQAASKLVRDLMRDVSFELSDSTRERLLAKALASSGESVREPRRTRKETMWLASAAVLAACFLGGYLAWPSSTGEHAEATPTARPARDGSSNTASNTAVPEHPATGVQAAEDDWFIAEVAQTQHFAHATVVLSPATRIRFNAETRTLTLGEGHLEVDVDAAQGTPFVVHTQHFQVEVLGTHFTVTPERVHVTHGKVRIRSHSGEELAPLLGQGETFAHREPGHTTSPSQTAEKLEDPKLNIAKAQSALAQGATSEARSILSRIHQKTLARPQRAEIATLLAEASLLEREPESAMAAYQAIATRYSDLKAGENAAFAAAQLAGRVAPSQERSLLEQYLRAHPKGRFVREATARLEKLAK